MNRRSKVAELRWLIRRRTAARLARDHGLELDHAEAAADLVLAGLPEGVAVGEVRYVLESAGAAGLPGHIEQVLGWWRSPP